MGCLYRRPLPFLNIFWWFLPPRKAVFKCTHLEYNYSSSLKISKCTLIGIQSCFHKCFTRGIVMVYFLCTYKGLQIRTINNYFSLKTVYKAVFWQDSRKQLLHQRTTEKQLFTKMWAMPREINKEWGGTPAIIPTAGSSLFDLRARESSVFQRGT